MTNLPQSRFRKGSYQAARRMPDELLGCMDGRIPEREAELAKALRQETEPSGLIEILTALEEVEGLPYWLELRDQALVKRRLCLLLKKIVAMAEDIEIVLKAWAVATSF
jgi:hypothetical protein